jgi:hypothetical protein
VQERGLRRFTADQALAPVRPAIQPREQSRFCQFEVPLRRKPYAPPTQLLTLLVSPRWALLLLGLCQLACNSKNSGPLNDTQEATNPPRRVAAPEIDAGPSRLVSLLPTGQLAVTGVERQCSPRLSARADCPAHAKNTNDSDIIQYRRQPPQGPCANASVSKCTSPSVSCTLQTPYNKPPARSLTYLTDPCESSSFQWPPLHSGPRVARQTLNLC